MKRTGAVALALVLILAGCVTTTVQTVPAGPPLPSYVTFHAGFASKFPSEPAVWGSSLTVDWGGFQSKYVAAGTIIGVSRADPKAGVSLLLGGGPQFHIPLGKDLLLIPALNLAYRISAGENGSGAGFGLAGYASLAGAYRFRKMYAGLEAETPLLIQDPQTQAISLFPGAVEVKALFGFYY